MTDIEISESVKLKPIVKIAKKLGLKSKDLILFGNYKAKINKIENNKKGKLILVTAINPTKAGIGKTTVSIGLADAFTCLNKKVCLALREPSLGPVFGMKGGATGGGRSQIAPMIDINLHFNGDFHAITSANNLLCSMIDNHIFQGNDLKIKTVVFNRCLDLNDRALREITVSKSNNATPREDKFNITAASEIMAIMCLSKDLKDLKERLGNILIAYDENENPVYAKDIKAENAMAILLQDALKPNLVQTLEKTPAIVHLGPFANIAHGCNSIIATQTALSLADYVITEAGFGSDLGAEKFFDIKCRVGKLKPSAVVLIATIKALKLHGGANEENLAIENFDALKLGLENLLHHINVLKNTFGVNLVVTLNKYSTDTLNEIEFVKTELAKLNVKVILNDVYSLGGKGAIELAKEVISLCNKKESLTLCYEDNDAIKVKIEKIAKKVYGASDVVYTEDAEKDLHHIKNLKLENYPVVIAKTQYSISDNKSLIGRPKDFVITIRGLEIRNGARFIVALAGDMLLMPGLGKNPAAINMKIYDDGKIEGIF